MKNRVFVTIKDMACCLKDNMAMDIPLTEVEDILRQPHINSLFNYGETITSQAWDKICQEVWADYSCGSEYPW